MYGKNDNTYNELIEKSINQWLESMSCHEDVTVRGGVKVAKGYIDELKRKISNLESKNALKDKYLLKLKSSK